MTTRERTQALREELNIVLTLARREIVDVLRDWRLVAPILILTLIFPVLANFTARELVNFANRYGGNIVGERMLPFLLMVVGFFPISFSLIIALEAFAGERERKSLEPLLASPLSDVQLYLGKTLASMIPPLAASYLGVTIYLIALRIFQGWELPPQLLIQVLALTTAEGLVMVSGAVIVSSQTTSVRAANLLASFIILPMAFLVQGESIIMFWGQYDTLWAILAFLLVVNFLLVRMGIRLFNREELMGREIDAINWKRLWATFRRFLRWEWWLFGRSREATPRAWRWCGVLAGLYLREMPAILRRSGLAALVTVVGLVGSFFVGWHLAVQQPFPFITALMERSGASLSDDVTILTPLALLGHNLRALVLTALFGTISFGSLAVAILMINPVLIAYLAIQVAWAGYSPWLFLLAFILPHGVLELPAAILATIVAVRMGATLVAPPRGMTVGDAWVQAVADFVKIFLAVVLPLLAVAGWVESAITPLVALRLLGG